MLKNVLKVSNSCSIISQILKKILENNYKIIWSGESVRGHKWSIRYFQNIFQHKKVSDLQVRCPQLRFGHSKCVCCQSIEYKLNPRCVLHPSASPRAQSFFMFQVSSVSDIETGSSTTGSSTTNRASAYTSHFKNHCLYYIIYFMTLSLLTLLTTLLS